MVLSKAQQNAQAAGRKNYKPPDQLKEWKPRQIESVRLVYRSKPTGLLPPGYYYKIDGSAGIIASDVIVHLCKKIMYLEKRIKELENCG